MSDDIKRMPVEEFREAGLLFEINRRVLHPLGLALEVIAEEDGTMRMGGIWDHRDDPEGMLYSEGTLAGGAAKILAFMEAEGSARLEERKRRLGYVVQPMPGDETP